MEKPKFTKIDISLPNPLENLSTYLDTTARSVTHRSTADQSKFTFRSPLSSHRYNYSKMKSRDLDFNLLRKEDIVESMTRKQKIKSQQTVLQNILQDKEQVFKDQIVSKARWEPGKVATQVFQQHYKYLNKI